MPGYRILYVEDDEMDVAMLKHAFRLAKVDIPLLHVSDGQEAVEYLTGDGIYTDRARFPLPSMLLVDVKMPRMGGLELLHWVRSHSDFAEMFVVMFSSSDHDTDFRRASELGANSYVVKPHGLEAGIKLAQQLENWCRNQKEFTPHHSVGDHCCGARLAV